MNLQLKVEGMHCKSCELLIKDSFEKLPDVKAQVNHKKGVVNIEFNEAKVKKQQLIAVIEKAGYKIEGGVAQGS